MASVFLPESRSISQHKQKTLSNLSLEVRMKISLLLSGFCSEDRDDLFEYEKPCGLVVTHDDVMLPCDGVWMKEQKNPHHSKQELLPTHHNVCKSLVQKNIFLNILSIYIQIC